MRELQTWIIEDDVYASDMMQSLVTRDWRTRIEKHTYSYETSTQYLETNPKLDCVLLDTETYDNTEWPFQLARVLRSKLPHVPILATCTYISVAIIKKIIQHGFDGLLLKQDMRYGVASAICKASREDWLTTDSVWDLIMKAGIQGSKDSVNVLSYDFGAPPFEAEVEELIRLNCFFNQSIADVADELNLAPSYVRKQVSKAYKHLYLDAKGLDWLYVEQQLAHKELVRRLQKQYLEKPNSTKTLLTFYLLTTPTWTRKKKWK